MAESDEDRLRKMAEAIADGSAVAWEEVEAREDDATARAIVRELRFLAVLASVHREARADADGGSAPPEATVASNADAPREWGPFEVLEELGRGTFGTVYRARDLRLDRYVALKLFSRPPTAATGMPTVVEEGRLLARLSHPNIITVYGADIFGGVAGIWMELLHGHTLQQELETRGPLSAREAALIGIELCRALAAVHHAGLLHRDVKAQNVMREDGGRIVLMDFGAGRDLGAPCGKLTLAGTPLYMAPEVLAGGAPTPSSDLYSLGVLLYRLVTRQFPVSAATFDGLTDAHASGVRRRLRDVRPDLPASFIRSVESATAAEPGRRPATAAAFEEQLEAVLLPGEKRRGRRTVVAMAAMMIAITLGWNGEKLRDLVVPAPSGIRSLVVLPFIDLTGGSDQEYLADGVTHILIGNLARLKSLRVISRTSAMAYKDTDKPLATIARELNVDAIVEGSVARSGDRLRVTVQLVRPDEEHLWGQTYERPAADLWKVQGEISTMIADAVRVSLTPDERRILVSTPGMAAQAQEAFLRGLHRLNDFRDETLKLALADLLEAVRLDPTSARAFATLSQCYVLLGAREVVSQDEAYMKALQAATHALQLDDTVSEAHTQLAEVKFYHEWNWEWARREYERALELSPNNSHALARYSLFLSALGRNDEALEWATLAQQLDPLSRTVRFAPGMALFYARRYDEAIAAFLRLQDLPPHALTASDRVGLARAYAARGRFREAIDEMNVAIRQGGALAAWLAELARIHAEAGNRVEAARMLEKLESEPRRDGRNAAHVAFIHLALGSRDAAFDALNRAADVRAPALLWLNVDPRLDAVRSDPRYDELALRVGLPQ